ncbi:MAG: metallophosphoesterase [Firmicutes bacterium]|nr:metallophosphoesterase [Bacillota bacterium]
MDIKSSKVKRCWRIAVCSLILISLAVFALIILVFVDNKTLDFETIAVNHSAQANSGIKIVHLSDLHFPEIDIDIDGLLSRIKYEEPDIIAITGDLIGTRTRVEQSGVFEFIEWLAPIAPTFFVSGNHELNNRERHLLYYRLTASGVIIIDNQNVTLTINGNNITIIGLTYGTRSIVYDNQNYDSYIIVLKHTPSFDVLINMPNGNPINPNLILAGHIHGGQIRLFGRGLLCPDTLLFPRYQSGLYSADNGTKMVVSRGLGNSIIPYRFNNRPHIPIITIN